MAIYRSLLFSLLLIPLLEAHTLRVPVSWEEEETPDDSLVSVMFYGESQCPFCRKFVEVWQTIWTDPGFRKVVDYDFIPWGNAYFATTECGQGPEYNSDERHCWAKKCGGREFRDDDDDDDDDCFGPGPAIYQHSKKEGEVDIYESCVKKILGLEAAVDFTYCCEGPNMDDPYLPSSRDLMEKCISPSFEALNIQNCFDNDARVIERGNARATPSHPGVPYVVVDGTPLDNPMEVAEAICASLQKRGMKKPSACANLETVGILQSLWNILGFYKNWEE